jgi:16S rRNA C967 or C1407 C5-methylase (RsmB/RsmF family)
MGRILMHVKVSSVITSECSFHQASTTTYDRVVPLVLHVQETHMDWFEGAREELVKDVVAILGETWEEICALHNNPPPHPLRLKATYDKAQLFCTTIESPKYDLINIDQSSHAFSHRNCMFQVFFFLFPPQSLHSHELQDVRW